MRAVVPLNVAALRVSSTDKTNVTPHFGDRTAAFDKLPHGPDAKRASTGDTVWRPLEADNPPSDALDVGIHLHWELPEYFKRGSQDPDTGAIRFPPAPTRWLVVRTLSRDGGGAPPQQHSWIVESDYVAPDLPTDPDGITRPAVAVPLTAPDGTPYMFMGRVVDPGNPAPAQPEDYLPAYTAPDGQPLYLTSIGFVGAAFSGYYPDCRSVFGFWDTFADAGDVHDAINGNARIRFRVSYSVIGWLPDPKDDPLTGLPAAVGREYGAYVAHCAAEQIDVTATPADVFRRIASQRFDWTFGDGAISYTLDDDHKLTALTVPEATLCAGVVQDVVWDARDPSTNTPFLAAPDRSPRWTDQVDIAIGNTTIEAVSALVKSHLAPPGGKGVLSSYEILLDALQLGLLRELESRGNSLVALEQERHARAFSQIDGGHVWTVQAAATPGTADTASPELTLPVELAEQLAGLNEAQEAYDQRREKLGVMRRQLFMDWIIYVKQLVAGGDTVVDTDDLGGFISNESGGELEAVVDEGERVGLLHYQLDEDTRHVVGVTTEDGADTLAGKVVTAYGAVDKALREAHAAAVKAHPKVTHVEWRLDAVPAAPFWLPTDPVLAIEGDRIEPVRRNGPERTIAVRAAGELVTALELAAGTNHWSVAAASLPGLTAAPAGLGDGAAAVIGEAALLDPLWAPAIAKATGAADTGTLAGAIAAGQGGRSPLDGPAGDGLFAAIRAPGYERKPNPAVTAAALTITFTNAAKTALPPDAVGWSAQTALPEFAPKRADPFLPVWMTWSVQLDPLVRGAGASYAPTALEDSFALDADAIDLTYKAPESFTTGEPVTYGGAVVLSKKPLVSLTQQIDRYISDFPTDEAADAELRSARDAFGQRRVMSQALDTFNLEQTLRTTIPQIAVADLVKRPDFITKAVATAAKETPKDSWYDGAFNALAPISTDIQAEYNFGPLRSGFLEITQLRIIDTFGQVMDLRTARKTATGALQVMSSLGLAPVAGDSANAEKSYLPPRALAPSRVDAHWLSAVHDFVETNDHPATSPVCGWIVPNHLEVSLAFYDADGSAIGSFGLEHDDSVYRTRAGNTANPGDDLETDLAGVNPHIAALMRFVKTRDAGFLGDLMDTIERSDHFINPAVAAQDVSLSVLVGRPLAVARSTLALTTAGGVLPVSQANTSESDALWRAVHGEWHEYRDRQANTCAGLDEVAIPLRLGDLTDTDDGLVAFLPEGPYATVYSAAAPQDGANGVVKPGPRTVELTLGDTSLTITAIVDPRAPVHVTTGVLPTVALQIPPDQYVRAMQQLAVTFTTRPVLRDQLELRLPLPVETGFDWRWVAAGQAPLELSASPSTDAPIYGYGPRRLLEGWLDLVPHPPSNGAGPP